MQNQNPKRNNNQQNQPNQKNENDEVKADKAIELMRQEFKSAV